MKVTRLRRGMRIVCSDSEFDVLDTLVRAGLADMENEATRAALNPAAKRALRSDRFQATNGPLRVDQDNR